MAIIFSLRGNDGSIGHNDTGKGSVSRDSFKIAYFSPTLVAGVHHHFVAAPLSLGGSWLCPEEGLMMEVNSRVLFASSAISGSIQEDNLD